ncbi:hypothetical protein HEP22_026090, partial [Escherichia coli]|nr:hypothetical protein [Escherichia coli]
VKALVEAAEEAEKVAEDAAAQADKDGNGLITPEEAKAVEDANAALEAAKQAAQEAMDKLPEDTEGKAELQDTLDALVQADVPSVSEQQGGQLSLEEVKALVEAAEEAEKVAEDALKAAGDV